MINRKRFHNLFSQRQQKHILVIGDLILDHYIFGTVGRISPEAPVPVLEVQRETYAGGGAANVALNLAHLGFQAHLLGVVGNDPDADILLSVLDQRQVKTNQILRDGQRPTTKKSRCVAHSQQIVRIDREETRAISDGFIKKFCDRLKEEASLYEAVIFQDYNKGLLTSKFIHQALRIFKDKIITVDPKSDHFFDFTDISLFKPNMRELRQAFQVASRRPENNLDKIAQKALRRLNCQALLLTKSEQGMSLYERSAEITHIPTRAHQVYDVSGAGDTVIAVATTALACGASYKEAAALANYAASVVVAELGVVPIQYDQLLKVLPE